jgi:hypothetical protein
MRKRRLGLGLQGATRFLRNCEKQFSTSSFKPGRFLPIRLRSLRVDSQACSAEARIILLKRRLTCGSVLGRRFRGALLAQQRVVYFARDFQHPARVLLDCGLFAKFQRSVSFCMSPRAENRKTDTHPKSTQLTLRGAAVAPIVVTHALM